MIVTCVTITIILLKSGAHTYAYINTRNQARLLELIPTWVDLLNQFLKKVRVNP